MIKIIADSTCNLSKEIVEKYKITIVPLTIIVNNVKLEDNKDITADEFYEIMRTSDDIPTTEPANPSKFYNVFRDGVMNGIDDFIVITISSNVSESYYSALEAKKEFEQRNRVQGVRIHILDSLCISHGSGYLAMKAAMMRDEGASFEKIVDFLEKYKSNIKHFLSISDMDTIVKSGRSTMKKAKVAKLLGVEAILENKKGTGKIVNKVMGRKNVLKYYADEYNKTVNEEMTNFIIVGYTSDISYAKELKEYLLDNTNFRGDIYIMQMGPTIGAHIGLGGVSFFFVSKQSGTPFMDMLNHLKMTSTPAH